MLATIFGSRSLFWWDNLRLLAAAVSVIVIVLTPYAMTRRGMPWHQRARMLGLGSISAVVVHAYVSQLGTEPTEPWRLVVFVIGVVICAAGMLGYLYEQRYKA